jgi:hypothetical protein
MGEALRSSEVYDCAAEQWNPPDSMLPHMLVKRCSFAASVHGDQIYVVGGMDDSEEDRGLSSCEVFDLRYSPLSPRIIAQASPSQ